MKKRILNFINKSSKKSKGFNALITTVCLILLCMILIFVFKNNITSQVETSITNVAQEIANMSSWDTPETP